MNAPIRTVRVRLAAGAAGREDRPDAPVWVQVATAGTYKGYSGGDVEFTFDGPLFKQVVANFRRHPSFRLGSNGVGSARVVAWDFHHASEMPAASVGRDGAPAQGWILDLQVRTDANGKVTLWALTEWLEPARTYVKEGRYRWASVSILFDGVDAVTGQRIGAVLTSVALTNSPFIEGMQPLAASKPLAHSPKGPTKVNDLQKAVIERTRVLRGSGMQANLALRQATVELMPAASNDERRRVWSPLLNQHHFEELGHALKGAQLVKAR